MTDAFSLIGQQPQPQQAPAAQPMGGQVPQSQLLAEALAMRGAGGGGARPGLPPNLNLAALLQALYSRGQMQQGPNGPQMQGRMPDTGGSVNTFGPPGGQMDPSQMGLPPFPAGGFTGS